MKESIINYFKEDKNGLYIIDPSTGYGKTYQVIESMYDYYYSKHGRQKTFFITTLLKNLPVDDFKKVYRENGREEDFDKDVLVIKSNTDYVCDNLENVKVPPEISGMDEYKDLLNAIKRLKNEKFNYDKKNIQDTIRTNLEPAFRHKINERLSGSKKEKKMQIKNSDSWIAAIYPTVFMDDYKIYFLSAAKLMYKNSTIVEPSYFFLEDKIMENSNVIFDEFDSIKKDMLKIIIEESLKNKTDLLEMMRDIRQAIQFTELSTILRNSHDSIFKSGKNKHPSYDTLNENSEKIVDKFLLQYRYKTKNKKVIKNFLFKQNGYYEIIRKGDSYIRITKDEQEKNVGIYFESKADYDVRKNVNDINIFNVILEIDKFSYQFKKLIDMWAVSYQKICNSPNEKDDYEFSLDSAKKTILNHLSLKNQKNFLLLDMNSKRKNKKIDPDLSFYQEGFRYLEFIDQDTHNTQTIFSQVSLLNTPEKILLNLSKKARVLGISATGNSDSVIANFDLEYLRNELGSQFKQQSEKLKEKIHQELELQRKGYRNGQIQVKCEVLNYETYENSYKQKLEQLFSNQAPEGCMSETVDYICDFLTTNKFEGYQKVRYLCVIEVLWNFAKNDELQSFLCLGSILPKKNRIEFDLNFLNECLNRFNSHRKERVTIVVLDSDQFKINKENLLVKLTNGDKVFIMSSYESVGAGQNLQYDLNETKKDKYILSVDECSPSDSRHENKDIDGLYLGPISNVIPNIYSEKFSDVERLLYCVIGESMYEHNEISYKQLKNVIDEAFNPRGSFNKEGYKALKNSKSYRGKVTRDVIQAVGRICRSFVKNKTINIYIHKDTLNELDVETLQNGSPSPELEAITALYKKEVNRINIEENNLKYEMERKATRVNSTIKLILKNTFNEDSVKWWKELRLCTLCYPTASKKEWDKESNIRDYYLTTKNRLPFYQYTQVNDYSNISIILPGMEPNSAINEHRLPISTVNQESAKLDILMNVPGLKEYFEEHGWATEFKENDYILSPALFNNIYKPALGEKIGKFIFRKYLNIELKEIENYDYYEFFDNVIKEGCYVDFKNWNARFYSNQGEESEKTRKKINRKLDEIGGKKVYIVNLMAPAEIEYQKTVDGRIVEIPSLIKEDGSINYNNIRILLEEIEHD